MSDISGTEIYIYNQDGYETKFLADTKERKQEALKQIFSLMYEDGLFDYFNVEASVKDLKNAQERLTQVQIAIERGYKDIILQTEEECQRIVEEYKSQLVDANACKKAFSGNLDSIWYMILTVNDHYFKKEKLEIIDPLTKVVSDSAFKQKESKEDGV